jgi:hypothetical protein
MSARDLDPACRVYLVERHVPCMAEMTGICRAYVEHSRHADKPAILAPRARFRTRARPRDSEG